MDQNNDIFLPFQALGLTVKCRCFTILKMSCTLNSIHNPKHYKNICCYMLAQEDGLYLISDNNIYNKHFIPYFCVDKIYIILKKHLRDKHNHADLISSLKLIRIDFHVKDRYQIFTLMNNSEDKNLNLKLLEQSDIFDYLNYKIPEYKIKYIVDYNC